MTALALKFFPKATADAIAEFEQLTSVALFCSLGLLVSVTILVIDKYSPGEWF